MSASAADIAANLLDAINALTLTNVIEYRVGNGAAARIVKRSDIPSLTKSYEFWSARALTEAAGGSMASLAVYGGVE